MSAASRGGLEAFPLDSAGKMLFVGAPSEPLRKVQPGLASAVGFSGASSSFLKPPASKQTPLSNAAGGPPWRGRGDVIASAEGRAREEITGCHTARAESPPSSGSRGAEGNCMRGGSSGTSDRRQKGYSRVGIRSRDREAERETWGWGRRHNWRK